MAVSKRRETIEADLAGALTELEIGCWVRTPGECDHERDAEHLLDHLYRKGIVLMYAQGGNRGKRTGRGR